MEYLSTQSLRPRQAPRSTGIQNPTGRLFTKRVVNKTLPPIPSNNAKSFATAESIRSRSPSPPHITSNSLFPNSWSDTRNSYTTVFEEDFMDESDNDSALVPLRISNSVKEAMKKSNLQEYGLPFLIIPPSLPSQKSNDPCVTAELPKRPPKLPLSPGALAALVGATLGHSRNSSSLDGSLTSDEAASLSCPSTPPNEFGDGEWDMPYLLEPEAIESLRHLSPPTPDTELDHAPVYHTAEMHDIGLNITMLDDSKDEIMECQESLSGISIPSPGGFFASLDPPSRDLWCFVPDDVTPSTATAEKFYGFTWQTHGVDIIQHVVEAGEDNNSDGPPTARQEMFAKPVNDGTVTNPLRTSDQNKGGGYHEFYQKKLTDAAATNLNRTDLWISTQETYLAALRYAPDEPPLLPVKNSNLPVSKRRSLTVEIPSLARKCVRFTGIPKTPVTAIRTDNALQLDALYLRTFQDSWTKSHKQDVMVHSIARADAAQMQRLYLPDLHRSQLLGQYAIRTWEETSQLRVDYFHLSRAKDVLTVRQYRDSIILADRERQAQHQTALARWYIAGCSYLNGGRLLQNPAYNLITTSIRQGKKPKILNFAGIATADWGWAAALEYPDATIHTAVASSDTDCKVHNGPENHRVVNFLTPWILPFPNDTFDVISAQTLHSLLHVKTAFTCPDTAPITHPARQKDEYQLTLCELRRVLRPNGVLQFSTLDAELSCLSRTPTPPTSSQATLTTLGLNFASALRSANYDPTPSRAFATRLRAAGFCGVTKANLSLTAGFPREKHKICADVLATLTEVAVPGTVVAPSAPPPSRKSKAPSTPKTPSSVAKKLSSPGLRRVFGSASKINAVSPASNTPSNTPFNTPSNTPSNTLRKANLPSLNLLDAAATKSFASSPDTKALPTLVPAQLLPPAQFQHLSQPTRPPPPPPSAPDGPGNTSAAALASMLGAVAWERWMLKLQLEQGREEGRLFEGVAKALEGVGNEWTAVGAGAGVGWRMCVGCARKG